MNLRASRVRGAGLHPEGLKFSRQILLTALLLLALIWGFSIAEVYRSRNESLREASLRTLASHRFLPNIPVRPSSA